MSAVGSAFVTGSIGSGWRHCSVGTCLAPGEVFTVSVMLGSFEFR